MMVLGATRAFAVLGVGDVVIVASNPAQELLWAANELPKWIELIGQTQEQVNKAQEMINLIGNPEEFASQIIGASSPAFALTSEANQLKTARAVQDFTQSSWTLYNSAREAGEDVLKVDPTYLVLGHKAARDREKYVRLAMEKALNARFIKASEKKQEVDGAELKLQEQTLKRLAAAKTETEIATHQATIAASRQRMEIAAARMTQAQGELAAFRADMMLEKEKDLEEAKEWAGSVVDRATQAVEAAMMAGGSVTVDNPAVLLDSRYGSLDPWPQRIQVTVRLGQLVRPMPRPMLHEVVHVRPLRRWQQPLPRV